MKRVLIWLPLALFAGVLALVASGLIKPGDRTIRSALIDKPLPGIELPPLVAGKEGIRGGVTGKPRLINVFASWCLPCIAEARQLMKLREMGVEIDGIATADTPEAMAAFLQANGDPYARIGDDRNRKVQFSLGSAGVPETFVIDARGRIIKQHIGDIREEHLPELLAALEAGK
ncbi:redoxin family protein [Sphingomonas sp.]|jgi:cytochrome c biogenesis protein CcmG/thiol:disulfide interchange protein DsbE|uniref:redoxin family protein n=1 Tax=Sphingomonas sp. TaxID=28214 RepID=UPI002ED85332